MCSLLTSILFSPEYSVALKIASSYMFVATVIIVILSVKLIIASDRIKEYRSQLESKNNLTAANVPTKDIAHKTNRTA